MAPQVILFTEALVHTGERRAMLGRREGFLILLTMALVLWGLLFVYSATFPLALRRYGDPSALLKRQLVGVGLGILLLFFMWSVDYHLLGELSPLFLLGTLILLLLTYFPGIGVGGRWLALGPFTLQPSELGKLALLLYLGASIVRRGEAMEGFREGILPHLVVLGIFGLVLISQPDFGMFVLYGALTFFLLWVGGAQVRHLGATVLGSLPLAGVALVAAPYRLGRLLAFLDPASFRDSYGYQVWQSLLALGAGGIFGRGLGASRAKLFYLPSAHNDFIFAVVGEESGFLGALLVIALLVSLVLVGLRIAAAAPDRLGTLYALGVSFLFGFQALLNLGVVVGVFPVTGLTLPFISYGGSSLLVSLGGVGLLLGVARRAEA